MPKTTSITKPEDEVIMLQNEVIEFLRVSRSSFFEAERYLWLRNKSWNEGTRVKYKRSDVLAFIDYLQKNGGAK